MSNIISKIRQRIALKKDNKFDLSCDHITTTDFFHISPVYFKEMVPGENIKIQQQTFTRLAPLVNPMLGRCRITNRAFFVPMRTIFKGWNEFITDVPVDSKFLQVPQIDVYDLAQVFKNSVFSTTYTPPAGTTPTANAYDFGGTDNGTAKYYKFTDRGRKAWKILQSLGYRFPLGYYLFNDNGQQQMEMSALPLLAYAKIFKDWYQNQSYPTNVFDTIFEISKNTASGVPYLTTVQLRDILNYCSTAVYDKDYFTSAWDKPIAPNTGLNSANTIRDISNDRTGTTNAYETFVSNVTAATANATTSPSLKGASSGSPNSAGAPYNITQYAIDALKSLTDYLKRHQIAGGLAMDRMLARFGVKPIDAKLDRSVYLGKDEVDVQIADVMATANGSGGTTTAGTTSISKLGEYAGKGLGYSENGWFKYQTDEFGYIIVISVLTPKVGYVQGTDRYNLHLSRLDFFTPEFDSLGVQAIARRELVSNYLTVPEASNLATLGTEAGLNGVFGYTSRYAEYKTQRDNLTGDFTVNSRNVGLDSWHLNRMFDPATLLSADLSHSFNFVQGEDSQYDRVFAYKDGNSNSSYDHFYVIHHFNIVDYAPMAQLFDDYEFDGGSKEVSIEVNGTQLN